MIGFIQIIQIFDFDRTTSPDLIGTKVKKFGRGTGVKTDENITLSRTVAKNTGFENIKSRSLAFLITERNENSPAKFTEEILARFALSQGVPEDKVKDWRDQLSAAEDDGRFGFTSFPVLTEARLK